MLRYLSNQVPAIEIKDLVQVRHRNQLSYIRIASLLVSLLFRSDNHFIQSAALRGLDVEPPLAARVVKDMSQQVLKFA